MDVPKKGFSIAEAFFWPGVLFNTDVLLFMLLRLFIGSSTHPHASAPSTQPNSAAGAAICVPPRLSASSSTSKRHSSSSLQEKQHSSSSLQEKQPSKKALLARAISLTETLMLSSSLGHKELKRSHQYLKKIQRIPAYQLCSVATHEPHEERCYAIISHKDNLMKQQSLHRLQDDTCSKLTEEILLTALQYERALLWQQDIQQAKIELARKMYRISLQYGGRLACSSYLVPNYLPAFLCLFHRDKNSRDQLAAGKFKLQPNSAVKEQEGGKRSRIIRNYVARL